MGDILRCVDEDKLLKMFNELYEKGKYKDCVKFIEMKLSNFSKKFYDVMVVYLRSLIKTNNKEKALKLVSEELSMPYIPLDFENVFKDIYKEASYVEREEKDFNLSRDKIEEILSKEEDKNMIILAIVEICKLNIRDFLNSIQTFLKRDVKNIYKVMLIDAMRGQGVNNEFTVINHGHEYKVVPLTSINVLESKEYNAIRELLENKMKGKDLNINSLVIENLMIYLSDIYPEKIEESEYAKIACSLQYYINKMYDESLLFDTYLRVYDVKEEDCLKYLKDLESACSI